MNEKHESRTAKTIKFLSGRRDVFDRITVDGRGGRVRWAGGKPNDYNGREMLPWDQVRGRYWYPWRS